MIKKVLLFLCIIMLSNLPAASFESVASSFLPAVMIYSTTGSESAAAEELDDVGMLSLSLPAMVSSSSLSLEGLLSGNILRMGKNTVSIALLAGRLQKEEVTDLSGVLHFSPSISSDGAISLSLDYDDVSGKWKNGEVFSIDGFLTVSVEAERNMLSFSVNTGDIAINEDTLFSGRAASLSVSLSEDSYMEFLKERGWDRAMLRANAAYVLSLFEPFRSLDVFLWLSRCDSLSALDIASIVFFMPADDFPLDSLSLRLSADGKESEADVEKALSIALFLLSLVS